MLEIMKITNIFKWKDQIIKEHKLIVDDDFLKANNISEGIGASGLILIFNHYYNIDIGDYGLREFTMDKNSPRLTIDLREEDFREILLSDILL